MSDEVRAVNACDVCKQEDDHPKLHYGDATYHHDCVPPFVEQDVTRFAAVHPHHAAVARVIEAARSGLRGDELHAFLVGENHDKLQAELPAFLAKLGVKQDG